MIHKTLTFKMLKNDARDIFGSPRLVSLFKLLHSHDIAVIYGVSMYAHSPGTWIYH